MSKREELELCIHKEELRRLGNKDLVEKYLDLERQLAEAEKALVEAHYLRFDSFLSEVEEFNYKNRNLIKALQEKHCRYLYELKEKGENE